MFGAHASPIIPVVREAEDVTEGSELDSGEVSTYRQ